jgi:hypothetical protein
MRLTQLPDQLGVERVVDLWPVETDARDDAPGPTALDGQVVVHEPGS